MNEDSFKQSEHDCFLSTLANLIFESNPQYSNQTLWHSDSLVIYISQFRHQLLYLWLAELREEFFNALCSIGTSCLLINRLGLFCKKAIHLSSHASSLFGSTAQCQSELLSLSDFDESLSLSLSGIQVRGTCLDDL